MALRPRLSTGLLLSDFVEPSIAESFRFSLCISVISAYRNATRLPAERRRQVHKNLYKIVTFCAFNCSIIL